MIAPQTYAKFDSCFCLFFRALEGTFVERQGTAVVRSCQNHVDKQWFTSSAAGSIPHSSHFFFF